MVYLDGVFCFLHVSRTGGCSVEFLASRTFRDGALIATGSFSNSVIHRHMKGFECVKYINDFDSVWKWAVTRNSWDLINSSYKFFLNRGMIKEGLSVKNFINKIYNGFAECFSMYDGDGQFDIEPIEFDLIKNKDKKTIDYLSKKTELDFKHLPHINSSKDFYVPWTLNDIEYVEHIYRVDINRFNYKVPKEIYNVAK